MFVVTVEFSIKPGYFNQFLQRVKQQARDSLRLEPDCQVFDVCTSGEIENLVFLYEIYRSAEAFQTHLESDHFHQFNQHTGDWVGDKKVRCFSKL